MQRGAETIKETSFTQAYGRDLSEAHDWCQKYKVNLLHSIYEYNQI